MKFINVIHSGDFVRLKTNMDDVVSYPCLECPFNCYKKKKA